MRAMALEEARLKAEQKAAPAYCFRFDWHTPVLDGRPLAQHGSDMAFALDNTAKFENMTGNGPAARALAARMSEAWIHFARTGDPNHPAFRIGSRSIHRPTERWSSTTSAPFASTSTTSA